MSYNKKFVFSFAILMVEMCTREEPYTKELSFMDPGQVLELIVNKDAPTAVEARKVLDVSYNKLFNLILTLIMLYSIFVSPARFSGGDI